MIKKGDKVTLTATLRSFTKERSNFINIPDIEWAEFDTVTIELINGK